MAACRRMQVDPYLSPLTKLESKGVSDLNVNPDTLNLIEEKVGNSLELSGTDNDFLNRSQLVQALRQTINRWDLTRLGIKRHRHSEKAAAYRMGRDFH